MNYEVLSWDKNNEIHSIKKLSDGSIFSIGDRVVETIKAWNDVLETNEFTIYMIPFDNGVVYSEEIHITNNGEDSGEHHLFNIKHIK